MYKEIVAPDFTWKNFSAEEQLKILAADRSNNCLDTSRLAQLCPEVSSIKDAVRTTLVSIKKHLDAADGASEPTKKQAAGGLAAPSAVNDRLRSIQRLTCIVPSLHLQPNRQHRKH
jgi:hypothetical protein